tara:strand:- start:314 stop:805 length:492 start_codon:yes stop_codon:yes gene_type:complete
MIILAIIASDYAVGGSPSPGKRYWRLKGTNDGSFSGGALCEIEFYDSIGGSNIVAGGTEIAGSEAFGGTKEQAFDGDKLNSFWAGASGAVTAGTSWIGYDFGAGNEKDVVQFEITARSSGGNANQVWDEWDLEYSDDGIIWTNKNSYSDFTPWTSNETRKYTA